MVARTLATGSVASCDCQPSEPSVIHDLVRLRLHQIVPVAPISVRIDRPPRDARGPTKGGEAGGGSSCGGEFSPGGGSTQLISDGCTNANRKVLVKGVGEHLLPTAQAWTFGPSGSGSTRRKPSYRPVLLSHSRSSLGHAAPGSVGWRRDETEDRRDAL